MNHAFRVAVAALSSLRTQAFWSVGPSGFVRSFLYLVEIPIKGPKSVPDGVVCVTKPAKNTPCASTQ